MAGLVGGRWGAAVAVVALVSTIVVTAATPTAASPIEPAPDPMPTWQTDGALVNGKNPSGRVWHIEYGHGTSAGMVFIAGRFDSVRAPAGGEGGTVQRSFVAALDVDTGYLIERFSPTITADEGDLEIRALELSGDGATLYIGGWFTMVNGEGRRHLAALDAITGAVHEWNPTPSGKVDVLTATADGSTLYAGGHFLEVGGTTRTHVAAFDMTAGGTLIGDFDPMIQQPGPRRCGPRCWPVVLAMTLSPDEQTLYVGGAFGIVDGEERNSAVALDTSDGTVLAWNPNIFHTRPDGTGSLNTIYELAATTERVYLCGDYWAINTDERGQYASPNVQAVDAVSGLADRDWVGSTDGAVNDCAIVGDTLIIGGHFDYAGGVKPADENGETRRHIAGLDLVTGDLTAWDPAANSTAGLYAVGRHVTDYLGVGGDFTTVNGDPQEGFAQFPIGVPGPGAVVFDEGFANGLGSWTKVKNLTTDPTSGGADPPSAAGTATVPARAFAWYELPTPRRALCVSVEVRIDSVASSRSTLLKLRAADGRAIAEVFRRQNGKVKLRSIVSGERSGTTAVLETGVWYTVETCLTKGADPQWEIAVDGVQVAAWRPDVGNRKFGIVQIGDDRKRVWDGRFDDVVVRRR